MRNIITSFESQIYEDIDLPALENIALIIADEIDKGSVILLYGNLGSGKTTFASMLIKILTNDTSLNITSPTFNLVQVYEGIKAPIWHFDLYRLENSEEILDLGFEDAITFGISIIEWPEIIENKLPPEAIRIYFEKSKADHLRTLTISK